MEKQLGDKKVEILDPATGTGTFICDIIDYLPKSKLEYKYKNELHANEVAILPYYISNLNIEYTYKQKMGAYAEFENLCFVDTLDKSSQHFIQAGLFGVSAENATRIRRQNERKISVIIGNPPYNANQANENDNNKNREYPVIDKRIKDTYIKNSTAQKTKMYDMYSRFYRWAMDRLNDNGIIAFITNRSFIDSRTFDGFRKTVQEDFDNAYIIDTRSDVRANPKIAGTTHNVFGIQTGVAVLFLVKTSHRQMKTNPCRIEYTALDDFWKKDEKLAWFAERKLEEIDFDNIVPDKNNNWINIADNDWDILIPLINKEDFKEQIFTFSSLGVSTNRDEWVYDFDERNLLNKAEFFVEKYNELCKQDICIDNSIKWSSSLKSHFSAKKRITFNKEKLINASYRPFIKQFFYSEKMMNDRLTQNHYEIFGIDLKRENKLIGILAGNRLEFTLTSNNILPNLATFSLDPARWIPLYRYTSANEQISNITDWGLQQFQNSYQLNESSSPVCYAASKEIREDFKLDAAAKGEITKEDIFYYTYAVLHNPAYRKKYELNLKREFPRIPFYDNFFQWRDWGKELMDLHINYESVQPYPLERKEVSTKEEPKAKLKALKESGVIQLDENTELHGIPKEAWEYKLGNRSALEWILDQYKEKKPKDPTIAEKFNTYKFADYKEKVIDLLGRVCSVSVETVEVVGEMGNQD